MFRATLFAQWRFARWYVVTFALMAFAHPIITTAVLGGTDLRAVPVADVLSTYGVAGFLLPVIALIAGITLGALSWSVDLPLGFVYMLVHPVPRWYLVLLRFAACALIAAAPIVALLVGNLLVTVAVSPPEFVSRYPVSQALRFGVLLLSTFGVFFGLSALSGRARDDAERMRSLLLWGTAIVIGAPTLVWLDNAFWGSLLARSFNTFMESEWSPLFLVIGRWGLFNV